MTKLFGGSIHNALIHAATAYDIKEAKKKYHNHYALAQYLMRIDEVEDDIAMGAKPRSALMAAFNGRLLDHLLVAIGEPKFTRDEMQSQSYTYRKASDHWRAKNNKDALARVAILEAH